MFAQDNNGNYLTWTSLRLGYNPKSKCSLSGFHRPPQHPDCVLDYFRAISRCCYEFQRGEMEVFMYDQKAFFGLPDAMDDEDDTLLEGAPPEGGDKEDYI